MSTASTHSQYPILMYMDKLIEICFLKWIGLGLTSIFWNPVDWSGRREDSCGRTGQGRPRRSAATRRLPGPPAESEAPGVEINRQIYQSIK